MANSKNQDGPIKNHVPEPPFVTWDTHEEKMEAIAASANVVESYEGIGSSTASHRSFLDVESNISVRTV